MKKVTGYFGILLVLVSLTGCFQTSTVIRVKSDGSGTVEETFLLKRELIEQMRAMVRQMTEGITGGAVEEGTGGEQVARFDVFNMDELRKKAVKMGEGVTLVSGEKIATDAFEGYKAVYAFTDINRLKITQGPDEGMTLASGGQSGGSEKREEGLMFRFDKGAPATLTIRQPAGRAVDKAQELPVEVGAQGDEPRQENLEQLKKLFEGMKFALAVEVQGTVIETNAAYREGSRMTLMEMDFAKLLGSPDEIGMLDRLNSANIRDAQKALKGLPGVKVDPSEEIRVTFR